MSDGYKLYITFGQAHAHALAGKTFDKDCVGVIKCKDYLDGRKIAHEAFNGVFATSYEEEQITDRFMSFYPRGLIEVN
jgi:hypothetical protein